METRPPYSSVGTAVVQVVVIVAEFEDSRFEDVTLCPSAWDSAISTTSIVVDKALASDIPFKDKSASSEARHNNRKIFIPMEILPQNAKTT